MRPQRGVSSALWRHVLGCGSGQPNGYQPRLPITIAWEPWKVPMPTRDAHEWAWEVAFGIWVFRKPPGGSNVLSRVRPARLT